MQVNPDTGDFTLSQSTFNDFEQSPYDAVLLWYANAGLDISERIHHLDSDLAKCQLMKEIETQQLNQKEKQALITKFNTAQGNCEEEPCTNIGPKSINSHMLSCGTCGMRGSSKFTEVTLESIATLVALSPYQLARYNDLKNHSPVEVPIDKSFKTKKI